MYEQQTLQIDVRSWLTRPLFGQLHHHVTLACIS